MFEKEGGRESEERKEKKRKPGSAQLFKINMKAQALI